MRILVVSAHFPPNFVSGGSVQPQHLATGLRARGHEVSVYAGWTGEGRRPLDTWTDVDRTGLPVRWVVTTPWTDWAAGENWANPAVAADFAVHLADLAPDVVHFHGLQSLGAGLVPAARRAGAAVAVTMHDFWWWCGRQFLVTRAMTPCCPVVDAGVCPCHLGRPWLDGRNAWLRSCLDAVDLVLAPSAVAATVLAANGADPARLLVDENGLPGASPVAAPHGGGHGSRPAEPSTDAPVRLLYVGGSDPMKGVHVLLDAVRRLAGDDRWCLAAHGVERYVRQAKVALDGLPVEVLPPFERADVDRVYGRADVLVVPSVMRESYSVATREALLRGVPVVCTDSLGPEEVVVDGHNGLVVPSADPAGLEAGLRRLLDEPGLLSRLRAGCADTRVRSLDDQVTALERRFSALASRRRAAGPALSEAGTSPPPAIRRVVFVCGIEGAPLRYRARLPAEALALLGVECEVRHYRDAELPRLVADADAVVVYRAPATVQLLALLEGLHRQRTPVLFDVDDLIFDPDLAPEIPALRILPPEEAALWTQGVRRYRTTMEACDGYVGSTAALCRHAAEVTGLRAERFDNGVGLLLARGADAALTRPRRAGPPRVGYLSGSRTHDEDWRFVEQAVVDALVGCPAAELWLVGHVPPSPALERMGDRVRRFPVLPWQRLPALLRQLDVNVAPLVPGNRFNEAKSAIKWLEAGLTETPTVATPTEPFREVIRPGENGLLAETPEDWTDALGRLLDDPAGAVRLGRRARRDALLGWSPHLQGRRYLALLERAADEAGAGVLPRPTAWAPVVLDEPPGQFALEPYGADALDARVVAGMATHLGSEAARLGRRAWETCRQEGPRLAAARALRYSERCYDLAVRPRVRRLLGRPWGGPSATAEGASRGGRS